MQFQYLGTAAAEGWPAIFCNCAFCKEAEKRGGRDVRTRSQSIINKDLLIDLPPDTYLHKLQFGLDLTAVRHLILTHKHMDHFYPQELTVRGSGYSVNMVSEDLDIYCAQEVRDFYLQAADWEADEATRTSLHWHILKPFEPVKAGEYTITPLPAHHMGKGNQPFMYYIQDSEGKKVLYLHDSGYYYDEVWDFFKTLGPVDMVSYDATYGLRESNYGGHMGIPEILRVREKMVEMGVVDTHTICVANHYSHNSGSLYDDLIHQTPAELMISFDGMRLTI